MQAHPQVRYPILFPFSTFGRSMLDPKEFAPGSIAAGTELMFLLHPEYDIVPQFPDPRRWVKYQCMGCKGTLDHDWFTRVFEHTRETPVEVEREMNDHARMHALLGGWGIIIHRRMEK